MEQPIIREMKLKGSFYYYSNGILIKTNRQRSNLPAKLFQYSPDSIEPNPRSIYTENDHYYLDNTLDSLNIYDGYFKPTIHSLLKTNDYVSRKQSKEMFIGYKKLTKERFHPITNISFLASISIEQKLDFFEKLFKEYNLELLDEETNFTSIPIPSLLTTELIVAKSNKDVRLLHYFKSLEHHLNNLNNNNRWIVADSFNLLNQKFENYFFTNLSDQNIKENYFSDNFDSRFPEEFQEALFIYAKQTYGYLGYVGLKNSINVTTTNFGHNKSTLKKLLFRELFTRYVQNYEILPRYSQKKSAETFDVFTLEHLENIGVFLFCFTTEEGGV